MGQYTLIDIIAEFLKYVFVLYKESGGQNKDAY